MKPRSLEKPNFVTVILGLSLIVLPFIEVSTILDQSLTPRLIFFNTIAFILLVPLILNKSDVKGWGYLFSALPLVMLMILYVLSIAYAPVRSEALFWSIRVATYTIFFLILSRYQIESKIQWKSISLFAGVAMCIIWMMMWQEIYEAEDIGFFKANAEIHQINSVFGHKNLFSSFLLLLTGLFALSWPQQGRLFKRLFFIFVLINCVFVVYLQSKAVLLSAVVAGLILFVHFFRQAQSKKLVLLVLGSIIVVVIAVILIKGEAIKMIILTGSLEERRLVWVNAVEMISDDPLLGGGAGSFQIYFPKYGLDKFSDVNPQIALAYQNFQRPHNDYLWIFSEVGILGLLSYVFFFAAIIYRALRKFKQESTASSTSPLIFLFFIIAYLVVAFFDFPWERSEHQFVLMLLLVSALSSSSIVPSKLNRTKKMFTTLLLSVFAAVCIGNVFFLQNRLAMERKSKNMVEAHSLGNWQVLKSSFRAVDPTFYQVNNFSIPLHWYKGVADFAENNLHQAHIHFREAYNINPYQIHVINNFAASHLKKGNFKKAIKLYDEALAIHPHHREILLNKAIAYYQKDQFEKAFLSFIEIDYDTSWSPLYNKAFPLIFNKYMDLKIDQRPQGHIKSWQNIKQSDSLKKVIIFEYHHNQKDWNDLIDLYDY